MKRILLPLCLFGASLSLSAQDIEQTVAEQLQPYFQNYTTTSTVLGACRLDSVRIDHRRKTVHLYADERFAYQPFRPESCQRIYQDLHNLLPKELRSYDVKLTTSGQLIESLVPNYYRTGKEDKNRLLKQLKSDTAPWVQRTSRPYEAKRGLEGSHIALWQSHGRYYLNKHHKWGWQRPHLFCTTEDQFTQSFILPYVIPMLENAGAYVFTPRERDVQRREVVVDNDGMPLSPASLYVEGNSRKANWQPTAQPGFAHHKPIYYEGENPFTEGTARFSRTEKKADKAFAEWVPDIPEKGKYAVYVSYQTLPESVSDAKYMVFHNGGITEFKVNQQIGGGTWVYLGTFEFDKGCNEYGMVVLSNQSKEKGVVCADAVRFGGGMGNIVRGDSVSGLPRYLEAARYSAQWAGMPTTVYSRPEANNDYADDLNVRSYTINHLAGGSVYNPDVPGLGVPFEMSMALHSDAGADKDDRIIGTLGIYTTRADEGKLAAGTDRMAARDLTDIIMSQLHRDIRSNFDIDWTRRHMWDRNYSETRRPAVAATIIELLSHQNFADMVMGHDPNFKFTVSRSIYKGILRYLSHQHGRDYEVQPLPVSHFAVQFGKKKNTVQLTWKGVNDPLEPTAQPREYIVYTRIGNGGFDNGVRVSNPSYTLKIEPGLLYSFRITALNRGGESFPSETLSAYQSKHEQGSVLIVNGFDRICGPAVVNTETEAGFNVLEDAGIAYQRNISLCGIQTDFDRNNTGKTLGTCGSEWEGKIIAGNTFDYPFVHGQAIRANGNFSFTSCSDEAVETGTIDLENYTVVDYIAGMEKDDKRSNPASRTYYKTFSSPMQRALTAYCQSGGRLMVSGSYIGSDMNFTQGEREFTSQVLKYQHGGALRTTDAQWQIQGLGRTLQLPAQANEKTYAVSAVDWLIPVAPAFANMTFSANGTCSAVAYRGNDYRTYVMGFPFESIESEVDRAAVMASILHFLTER